MHNSCELIRNKFSYKIMKFIGEYKQRTQTKCIYTYNIHNQINNNL